jgi:hypothetical protein
VETHPPTTAGSGGFKWGSVGGVGVFRSAIPVGYDGEGVAGGEPDNGSEMRRGWGREGWLGEGIGIRVAIGRRGGVKVRGYLVRFILGEEDGWEEWGSRGRFDATPG